MFAGRPRVPVAQSTLHPFPPGVLQKQALKQRRKCRSLTEDLDLGGG